MEGNRENAIAMKRLVLQRKMIFVHCARQPASPIVLFVRSCKQASADKSHSRQPIQGRYFIVFRTRLLRLLFENLFGLVDLGGEIGAAAAIGMVE